jgi:hypothetical protein
MISAALISVPVVPIDRPATSVVTTSVVPVVIAGRGSRTITATPGIGGGRAGSNAENPCKPDSC